MLKVEIDRAVEKIGQEFDGAAYLTPGAEGYSVVRADLGALTVKIDNVEPYANGSRITLQIGNLTSATINGAKAKMDWAALMRKEVLMTVRPNRMPLSSVARCEPGPLRRFLWLSKARRRLMWDLFDFGTSPTRASVCRRLSKGCSNPHRENGCQERLINWGYAICDVAMRMWVDPTLPKPNGFPYPSSGVG